MIQINNLCFSYSKKGKNVINNVSFAAKNGKIVVLLGPNGVGKSTLLKCVAGLLPRYEGQIQINGLPLNQMKPSQRAKTIAYVPQSVSFSPMSVFNAVLLGRMPHFGLAPSKEDEEKTWYILEEMGIAPLANRNVEELSGGERQKVAIARAINQGAEVVVFDEPTSNLDISSEIMVAKAVKSLAKEKGLTVLISMHDINLALSVGDKFVLLREGELLSFGDKESVNESAILSAFGVHSKRIRVEDKDLILFEEEL